MSYNTDLQSKITRIQSIIDTVNALPEAGSGSGEGADEVVSGVYIDEYMNSPQTTIFLSDGSIRNVLEGHTANFEVKKNTIIVVSLPDSSTGFVTSGGIQPIAYEFGATDDSYLWYTNYIRLFLVTGDFVIRSN